MKRADCVDTIQTPTLRMDNAGWRLLSRFAPAVADAAMSHFETMCEWQRRAEMRQRIARLDDALLDDIGLTRAQAEAEARKPFWKR